MNREFKNKFLQLTLHRQHNNRRCLLHRLVLLLRAVRSRVDSWRYMLLFSRACRVLDVLR